MINQRQVRQSCRAVMLVLAGRQSEVKSGVVFMGNIRLAALAGVSPRTVTEDKYLLERAGLVYLVNTGADGKCHGGKTHDEDGNLVAAATGYELHPDLQKQPAPPPRPLDPMGSLHRPMTVDAEARRRVKERIDRQLGRAGP